MFGDNHYVPVVLTKRGERRGLTALPDPVRDQFTPLFVVPAADWDYDNGAPRKDLDAHVGSVPSDLRNCWGSRRAFIDLLPMGNDGPMANGVHPLAWIVSEAHRIGLPLVPTVSPTRSTAYINAVATSLAANATGICLRLQVPEWPSVTGTTALDAFLASLGVGPRDVDLVLDCESDTGTLAAMAAQREIAGLPHAADWRSITLLASAIPKDTPPGQGLHVIDRSDWALYRQVRSALSGRLPTFGDYCVANPDPGLDVDPKLLSISAVLRYAVDDAWLFAKGALFKGTAGRGLGGAAVRPAADRLRLDSRFAPAHHCIFEPWVVLAAGTGPTGNPEKWRELATHHHLIQTTEQIASSFSSSTSP